MFSGNQVKHKEMKRNLLIQFLHFFPSVQYLCRLQDLAEELYMDDTAQLIALQAKRQISKLEYSHTLGSRHTGGPLVCPYTGPTFPKGHYCGYTRAIKGQGWV